MKILFISYAFYPGRGGIESSAELLAYEFCRQGHDVSLITDAPLGDAAELQTPFPIMRRPGLSEQLRLSRDCDLVYYHNPCLKYFIPMLAGKPCVTSIRTWIRRPDGQTGFRDRLKLAVLARQTSIANSRATAASVPFTCTVVENAYDPDRFEDVIPWHERQGAAFVGRLVSDKGADTALRAIAILAETGRRLPLTVIGGGPEESALRSSATELGIEAHVTFRGRLAPDAISAILNRHRYLLVPSRWAEPFGIVALEGIASGCIPIGTDQGGLVDAIGRCGPLFPAGDAGTLAERLLHLEDDPALCEHYRSAFAEHLSAHTPHRVAARYLAVFEHALSTYSTRHAVILPSHR